MRYSIAWGQTRVPYNIPLEFINNVVSAWKSVQLELFLLSVYEAF